MWKPKEIIVHETVIDDPVTKYILDQCREIPVKSVSSGKANDIIAASDILKNAGPSMLDKILAGKQVVNFHRLEKQSMSSLCPMTEWSARILIG